MKYQRPLVAITLATSLIAAGVTTSYAAEDSTVKTNPMDNLVQTIATKFNLNEADVQQVFDEQRATKEAEHKQEMTDRLAEAVTAGKLTQAQADLLTAKMTALEANRDNFKNMSEDERHTAMKKQMTELKQWAQDNNMPEEFFPIGGHRGPDDHFGHRPMDQPNQTTGEQPAN